MKLIIAMSNVEFAQDLEKELIQRGVKVLEIVTTEEDLLDALLQYPAIDGVLLKSDLALKLGESRLETLVDIIEGIRKAPQFKELVFTVLSDQKAGHPFLAELVELGIYNIIVKGQTGYTITSFINMFEVPRSFASAATFKNVDPTIPWRKNLRKSNSINLNFETNKQQDLVNQNSESKENIFGKLIKKSGLFLSKDKSENIEDMVDKEVQSEENVLEAKATIESESKIHAPTDEIAAVESNLEESADEWITEKSVIRPSVIGTVVVGVAGVYDSVGCTNTAINVAKFLAEQGYKVGLVEGNQNMDFDRIHSLHEGERHQLKDINFEIQGIHHIKFRPELNVNEVFTNFEYVVLDLGNLNKSPMKQEFYRAHIKMVCCSADEWKFYLIENFILEHELSDLTFVVPAATSKWTKDLASRLKQFDAYPIAATDSPYVLNEESLNTYESVFENYFKAPKKSMKFTLALTSAISISATLLIVLAYLTF